MAPKTDVTDESRIEQAETWTESAKTRTEQAEIRTEQAERAKTALQREVQKEVFLSQAISTQILKHVPVNRLPNPVNPLAQLTDRQREILQLVAVGQNTKQIAAGLQISPKTVEYHRMKLMNGLNMHDIPGLVRFAMQTGLLPQEN